MSILVSHMHGDHVGDRHIPAVNAGECAAPEFSVGAIPNTNSVNIALAKGRHYRHRQRNAEVLRGEAEGTGRQRRAIAAGALWWIAKDQRRHPDDGARGAFQRHSRRHDRRRTWATLLDETGLTAYAGPPTGYVVTFSNGLKVYLSGDTGITAEQETVVRDHYGVQLVVMNIGDTFTTGPKEAAYVVNELIKPAAVIASHANEQATENGKLLAGTRTEQFMQAARGAGACPAERQDNGV